MEVFYIYETPFKGQLKNTMRNNKVDFTGDRVQTPIINEFGTDRGVNISFENALNFEQYNEQQGGNLIKVTEDEYFKMLEDWENNNICGNFTEITPERWDILLNCLPPAKWHDYENLNIFFVPECFTGIIYTCCIKDRNTGKFYSALRRINETDEELKAVFINSLK